MARSRNTKVTQRDRNKKMQCNAVWLTDIGFSENRKEENLYKPVLLLLKCLPFFTLTFFGGQGGGGGGYSCFIQLGCFVYIYSIKDKALTL